MADDLGANYRDRMLAPVELTPEDEDKVQRLLGRTPVTVDLAQWQIKLLEKIAAEKGITLQQLLNFVGAEALETWITVNRPDDGQHRG